MIKALIGFGRLGTRSDQPEMLQFFDGVKVENTGRSVKLNADVSMSVLDGFLKMIEKRKPGA
ncbi:MAG: hypothetical protein HYZ37_01315 [Candidatus Solibacter usitatus]|nr:hypothetical protein [Candidatus Solibacter usitatus]